MAQRKVKKSALRTKKPQKLTRSQLIARDWKHESTSEINKKVSALHFDASRAEQNIGELQLKLSEERKKLREARADIEGLERLVETRQG